MSLSNKRATSAVLAGAAALAVIGGTGTAIAGPGFSNNNIHGCVGQSGQLRIAETCRKGELNIDWQARGKDGKDGKDGLRGLTGGAGAPGAQGDTGAAGPAGAAGAQGPKGDTGAAGKDGTNGIGSTGATGAKGDTGATGATGAKGDNGLDGKSAFELALTQGYSGSLVNWLADLQGDAGVDGADGADGADGTNGTNGTNGADADTTAINTAIHNIETTVTTLTTLVGTKANTTALTTLQNSLNTLVSEVASNKTAADSNNTTTTSALLTLASKVQPLHDNGLSKLLLGVGSAPQVGSQQIAITGTPGTNYDLDNLGGGGSSLAYVNSLIGDPGEALTLNTTAPSDLTLGGNLTTLGGNLTLLSGGNASVKLPSGALDFTSWTQADLDALKTLLTQNHQQRITQIENDIYGH